MIAGMVTLLLLPESGTALLVWPDGRVIRVESDESTSVRTGSGGTSASVQGIRWR